MDVCSREPLEMVFTYAGIFFRRIRFIIYEAEWASPLCGFHFTIVMFRKTPLEIIGTPDVQVIILLAFQYIHIEHILFK